MNDRKRRGNNIRLIGYAIEVTFVAAFLITRMAAARPAFMGEIQPGIDFIDAVLIGGMIFGAMLVATGTFMRARPPTAEELYQETLDERKHDG